MKRSIGERDDNLYHFKNKILEKGEYIYKTEIDNIITRKPNTKTMEFALHHTKNNNRMAGQILEKLYEFITHIPASQLFEDIRSLVDNMMDRIGDNPFYIYLSEGKHCDLKSNMFLAIMAMCRNKRMVHNFEDFICGEKTLYTGDIDPTIVNFVYLDDVTFSGKQIRKNLTYLGESLSTDHKINSKIHIVIPYINPEIMGSVMGEINHVFGGTEWYISSKAIFPKPVNVLAHDIISSYPRMKSVEIYSWLSTFLNTSPGSFDKALFYTDLKIPDVVSIYPRFFFDPLFVDGNNIPSRLGLRNKHLVSNCEDVSPRGDMMDSGNHCPYPLYKKEDWISQMKDMFGIEEIKEDIDDTPDDWIWDSNTGKFHPPDTDLDNTM